MATSTILNPLVLRADQVDEFERIMNTPSTYSYTSLNARKITKKELEKYAKNVFGRAKTERK